MARTARTSRITMKSTSGKVLASVALLGVAASVAGLGTYGSFTSTTSASETVTAGSVKVELGAAGTAANRLNVTAANIVPGDSIQRAVTLNNTGNQNFGGVTLSTTTATPNLLTTDALNGLQVAVDACTVPWTETGTAPAYTYTCVGGTTTTVLAGRQIIGANLPLNGLASITTGKTDNLRITTTLPTSANNDFQNLTNAVSFDFLATQRAATNR